MIHQRTAIKICVLVLSFWANNCFGAYTLEVENEVLLEEQIAKEKANKNYDFRDTTKHSHIYLGAQQAPPPKKLYNSMNNRYYTRLDASLVGGAVAAHFRLKERQSSDPSGLIFTGVFFNQAAVVKKAARGPARHQAIAAGYQWSSIGFEVEYVETGKINYNSTPPVSYFANTGFPGYDPFLSSGTLNSHISAAGLLFNLLFFNSEQELTPWWKVQSYAKAGLGIGETNAQATTANLLPIGDPITGLHFYESTVGKKRRNFALDFGLGARTRLTENFFLDTRVNGYLWPKADVFVLYQSTIPEIVAHAALEPRLYISGALFLGLTFLF